MALLIAPFSNAAFEWPQLPQMPHDFSLIEESVTRFSSVSKSAVLSAARLGVHEEGGPLYWFLDELFKASAKSPQTMAIVAVHLCGLWVEHPAIALLYLGFWERLLLYGNAEPAALKASDLSSEARLHSFIKVPFWAIAKVDMNETHYTLAYIANISELRSDTSNVKCPYGHRLTGPKGLRTCQTIVPILD